VAFFESRNGGFSGPGQIAISGGKSDPIAGKKGSDLELPGQRIQAHAGPQPFFRDCKDALKTRFLSGT
jgi:hypothetical protein